MGPEYVGLVREPMPSNGDGGSGDVLQVVRFGDGNGRLPEELGRLALPRSTSAPVGRLILGQERPLDAAFSGARSSGVSKNHCVVSLWSGGALGVDDRGAYGTKVFSVGPYERGDHPRTQRRLDPRLWVTSA
ncbi:hypothetical protein CR970_03635 [Candidatus Saccharibacteria bacterium]|nr:MAG: hypothetical protein CR970_03635 [Candidatus Saccharibacteria bacterium]